MSASEFKAKCLRLIDEVAESGKPLTITKHGRAVASLTPLAQPVRTPQFGARKGSVLESTDLISPTDEKWETES
ncbi:MAG: type II toxin-antitoxin system Phd/YefM family antitoxin [Burkholderiaceae bacterium]